MSLSGVARPVGKPADPLKHGPSLSLLVKLGSIVVHADEYLSPSAHVFDLEALRVGLRDPEVQEWIKDMGALLPVKRNR